MVCLGVRDDERSRRRLDFIHSDTDDVQPPSQPTMAAMLSQLTRNAGFMLRETGQAMDKLGCKVMGDYAFMEPRT